MISVLIPVHNYNILNLVKEIYDQLSRSNINFEILCLEDGSEKQYVAQNQSITSYKNTSQLISETNIGRSSARQLLCTKATYEWLLFIDADVKPKTPEFISTYLKYINQNYEAIFGGFAYTAEKPKDTHILRWAYGKNKEEIASSIRNRNPYKVIISANFLIKKNIFHAINSKIKGNSYGFDLFFGSLLKSNNIKVLHIDNEVYHIGIESSTSYLSKIETSINTLLNLYKSGKINNHSNELLSVFLNLKKYGLNHIAKIVYILFSPIFKKQLLSSTPSVTLLQLYKLCYICYRT